MVANGIGKEETEAGSGHRSAQLAQWTVYLALSTSIGFVWTLLYILGASTFGEVSVIAILDQTLFWFLGASFSIGLIYRLFALTTGRLPSLWHATAIPGIGAFFSLVIECYRNPVDVPSLIMGMVAALGVAYVCGGIVFIPLSLLHTKALQWLHVTLTDWAPRASVRSIRHVGYAAACACLLFATEAPRYWGMKARERAQAVAEVYGVKVPPSASLLSTRNDIDPETYFSVVDAHFRVPGGIAWPPVTSAVDLSQRENDRDVRLRFQGIAGHRVPASAKLEQVKWYEPGGWIRASRLRTPEADYVEFQRH